MSMPAMQPPVVPEGLDERVVLNGVTFKDYELVLLVRGDRSAPRIAYLEGQLEIMSPSAPTSTSRRTSPAS